jgi:hypothetical protein
MFDDRRSIRKEFHVLLLSIFVTYYDIHTKKTHTNSEQQI